MAKEPKTGKFRKGDLARIVTPLVFVRCGYPLDPGEVKEEILRTEQRRIREFLGISPDRIAGSRASEWSLLRAVDIAAQALTRVRLEREGFGGKKREIHTVEEPGIKGRIFTVTGWHFHKTGEYYAPFISHDYEYGAEYESGGLMNEKVHRILHLESVSGPYKAVKIEACHVEKVNA